MARRAIASFLIGLVAAAAGCRMCASPYDYCKPTFTGQPGEDCSPIARAGSILTGSVAPVQSAETLADQPLSDEVPYDEEIASGVIISVTEGKVDEAEVEAAETGQP
jgi:hypothetical protein